ncbi:MAG: dethiobiotin synthase [Myxococcales bacterium]|nr:MAG: dethiobiotin synthase [Myxococcales bacterium]
MHAQFLISGVGTEVGKTFVARGLSYALMQQGLGISAIKPIETGVEHGHAADAEALAKACGKPELATMSGFYRTPSPVAPLAAEKMKEAKPLVLEPLAEQCRKLAARAEIALCEGAGGLLVPLNQHQDFADFAVLLGWPVILVASDTLGVLSYALSSVEAAEHRGLKLLAVVLNEFQNADASRAHNQSILSDRIACPVVRFEKTEDSDEALAEQCKNSGLLKLCLDPMHGLK